jgi:hypothetical protein
MSRYMLTAPTVIPTNIIKKYVVIVFMGRKYRASSLDGKVELTGKSEEDGTVR